MIAVTRERRLRTNPVEHETYRSSGLRVVRIGSKQNMSSDELAELFLRSEARLDRLNTKLGAGPWFVRMTPTGVRVIEY